MPQHRAIIAAAAGLVGISAFLFTPGRFQVASAAPKVITIEIRNFEFQPATVTISAGDTVQWKNEDSAPHTATADPTQSGFDSGTIKSGASWSYVASAKGTYNYICTIHPYMKGTLVVQ
jgi:plastocyanin